MWHPATESPEHAPPDPQLPFCGDGDAALARVAARVARREAQGMPPLDSLELAFALRSEGEPHPWPRTWTLATEGAAEDDLVPRAERFLGSFADGGSRRCGVARLRSEGGSTVLALVVVDALADLRSVPTRARVGQWIRVEASMLVAASAAKLVVLGPLGAPRTVPTTLHGDSVEATFSVDREGPWTIQLLATASTGPRPVLEAMVFVDAEPPDQVATFPAPGEAAVPEDDGAGDAAAVQRMANAARIASALPPLRSSAALDRVAEAHAEAMRTKHRLGHDVGDGDPGERLRIAGLALRRSGENVAHARTVRRAHRALWASPSHRGNLLDSRFESFGVGVARDADGTVWVCQVFSAP